jgi:hypothetical protein
MGTVTYTRLLVKRYSMHHLLAYLRQLPIARQVLWCYLIWYGVMTSFHFDSAPRIWLSSLGISGVIGFGLILSVSNGANAKRDFWTTARLFMMPFCVSSFSALIKDRGFVLVFSPEWHENLTALGLCLLFVLLAYVLRLANLSPAQQGSAIQRAQQRGQ